MELRIDQEDGCFFSSNNTASNEDDRLACSVLSLLIGRHTCVWFWEITLKMYILKNKQTNKQNVKNTIMNEKLQMNALKQTFCITKIWAIR